MDPVVGKLVTELMVALVARVLIEELVDSVDGLVELTTTPTWLFSLSLDKLVCIPVSSSPVISVLANEAISPGHLDALTVFREKFVYTWHIQPALF